MEYNTPEDFIKDGFKKNTKYLPFDEMPEVIAAVENKEKENWREVYKFANTLNREGTNYTDHHIIKQCELYLFNKDKVALVFKKVFDMNPEEFGIANKPEIVKVELFLRRNWEFVRNVVTQKIEYRPLKGVSDFDKLNHDTLYRKIQHVNFKFTMEKLRSLLKSDFVTDYNPFDEYFKALEPWDRETDHIGKLANFITCTNQEFHVTQFRKMLARCVGCGLYGVENRFVYVLVGEAQETGKSTFIRFLSPFGKKYYTEAPIRDNKDSYFSFSENFLYNVEELASFNNHDIQQMKAIISMALIKERKPHDRDVEEQIRRVNFFASTNKDEFLTDTENTRWLIAKVESINWDYKKEIDIHKVWAQAYALYHDADFNHQLTKEENRQRDLANKNFEVTDVEKDLIKACFEIADEVTGVFYSNPDVLLTLMRKYDGKPLKSIFIGKNMRQLGFNPASKTINGHKTRGWWVLPSNEAIAQANEIEVSGATLDTSYQTELPIEIQKSPKKPF